MAGGAPVPPPDGAAPASSARRARPPVASSLLDLVGGTPLVELTRLAPEAGRADLREARGPEPDRVDQGSGRARDDRRRRGVGRAGAGPGAARADLGQHRDLPRARRLAARLPAHLRPPRERDGRAEAAAPALRRRARPLTRGRGLERRGPPRARARRVRPALVRPLPVREPGQPSGALRGHGRRDRRRPRPGRRARRRPRHGRHADGSRRAAARVVPRRDRRRSRAAARRPGDGAPVARRRLRAADPRRLEARPEGARLERGVRRRGARAPAPARGSSAVSRPARSSTSRAGSPTSSTRASSSRSSPTAAGSTSAPTSGRRPPRTSPSRWSRPSGGDPGRGARGDRLARARRAPERGLRAPPARGRRRRRVRRRQERLAVAVLLRARARPGRRGPTSATGTSSRRSSTPTSRRRRGPSRTDVERIGLWRDLPYVIYSVRLDELAAWRIGADGIESLPVVDRCARRGPADRASGDPSPESPSAGVRSWATRS